ncbi:MAG: hypothetical protein EX263_01995 [Flavobacteriaceae bacterium]|nr:hypothetical protein [Flavobacteriaceae bacterium]RZW56627.1 MAG: hypothetical protein EX263_01995 [Flavobacteriaceae bacterium]
MKKIIAFVSLTFFTISLCTAQLSVNDYKYVIVEKQFHFQNEPDEYNLNQLVKHLFRKYGFKVIIEGEQLPSDLKSNYCLALTSEVTAKGALRTKAIVFLRDCDNNVVFTSNEGLTKEKDFARAYDLAIRNAFNSFSILNYKYVPNERITSQGKAEEETKAVEEAKQEIQDLKAKIEVLEESKKTEIKAAPKIEKQEISVEVKEEKPTKPTISDIKEEVAEAIYFKAVANKNGFNLINSQSGITDFVIIKSELDDLFLVKNQGGVLYKKADTWLREYIKDDKTVVETLDIRF